MILALIDEAVSAGARLEKACEVLGLAARTVTRWRGDGGGVDRRAEAGIAPVHKLTPEERDAIVSHATSPEYRDLSPRQIVPLLADKGMTWSTRFAAVALILCSRQSTSGPPRLEDGRS